MAEKKNKSANIDVLGNVYNNILKGLSLGKTLIMLQGGGRCFAAGTRVRMYDGSLKNIEDIVVGDKVMNADGHSFSNVTETHSGVGQLYRIHPNKSECDYLVNGEHILTIKQTEAFSKKVCGKYVRIPFDKDRVIDISVNDFIAKPKEWKKRFSLFKCRTNEQKDEFTTHFTITKDEIGRYYGFTLDKSPYFMDYQGFVFHNSGKTYNTMIFLVLQCLNSVKKVSIVRQSLPVIKRSVLEDFKTIMRQMGQWDDRRFNKTDCIYYFPNGSVMEFFSAEDEQKLRGPSRDILYANEANEISYYAFSNLRMRTYGYCIVDYNPSFTEEHWLFPLMTDERTYFFKSTFKDNIFLPQAARDEIMSYKETNPALWKIYGEGEFAIIDGLVFPKENWDIIPDEEFPTWLGEEYLGLDWGFTCFSGDTLITTIVGNKAIKDIKAGDFVLTRNGYRRVVAALNKGVQDVTEKEICINGQIVRFVATDNHKFYANGKWKKYEALTKGDNLCVLSSFDIENTALSDIKTVCHKRECVYDLSIEDCHEYFANGVLVHNCDPTVCVGAIVNDTDIYVREHFRETGLKTKDIAQRLEPYRDMYKYCDIDNRLVSELEDAGIPLLTMTRKNGESIMTGIRLMNQRHIHIVSSSTELIKEFRNYVYKKDRHETYQTNLRPIDKFNHGVDALRYIVYAECSGCTNDDTRGFSKEELGIFM